MTWQRRSPRIPNGVDVRINCTDGLSLPIRLTPELAHDPDFTASVLAGIALRNANWAREEVGKPALEFVAPTLGGLPPDTPVLQIPIGAMTLTEVTTR